MKAISKLFSPNAALDWRTTVFLVLFQASLGLLLWFSSNSEMLPTPYEVVVAFDRLATEQNLLGELWSSLKLCTHALVVSVLASLLVSYATVMPFFRPPAELASKLRFMTLVGLSFFFVLLTSSGYELKVSLLTFGISVFLVTSFNSLVGSIPKNEYYHARTLGMSEWRVVWEVTFRSRLHELLDIVRQNLAISWVMLTSVEGLVRSDGGIGIMLLNQNKFFKMDNVFAIQLSVIALAILMDYALRLVRKFAFPYSDLNTARK